MTLLVDSQNLLFWLRRKLLTRKKPEEKAEGKLLEEENNGKIKERDSMR